MEDFGESILVRFRVSIEECCFNRIRKTSLSSIEQICGIVRKNKTIHFKFILVAYLEVFLSYKLPIEILRIVTLGCFIK